MSQASIVSLTEDVDDSHVSLNLHESQTHEKAALTVSALHLRSEVYVYQLLVLNSGLDPSESSRARAWELGSTLAIQHHLLGDAGEREPSREVNDGNQPVNSGSADMRQDVRQFLL